MTLAAEELMGMAPDDADGPRQLVGLVRAGAAWFTDPFFDESIRKLRFAGSLTARVVTFAELREAIGGDVASPRAVVLHIGRCGSTLLLRMLGRHRATLPVAEPQAVGNLHRDALTFPDRAPQTYQAIADILVLLDRLAAARGKRPVIKLSSWQTAGVAGLSDILGEVPIVVLHRPASEVVASEVYGAPAWLEWMVGDHRGMASWAPRLAELPESASPEEVCAGVWAAGIEAALALPPERTLFVSYADLVARTAEVLDAIAVHIGIAESWDPAAALSELDYYSKAGQPDRFDPAKRHARPPLPAQVLGRVADIVGDVADRLRERSLAYGSTTGDATR